jgi:hypothetical protein
MRVWVRWSAWLCLSLMLWTVAAESTHNHPNRTESTTCSICVVAHSASPAFSTWHGAPVFAAVALFREESLVAEARPDLSHLGIRGPPTV